LLAAPLAWWITPHLLHRHLINKITSPDLDERQRGLNYVIRRANQRSRVLRDVIAQLNTPDEQNFIQIAAALQQGGRWQHPPIPADAWLRWINLLARDKDPESRILAAQHLTSLSDHLKDPGISGVLELLLDDDDIDVRYNALIVCAELAGMADVGARENIAGPYRSILETIAGDEQSIIHNQAAALLVALDHDDSGDPLKIPPATLEQLKRGLHSPFAHVRDVACTIAAEHLNDEQLEQLIINLLNDFDDNAKRSGAILAGLTGWQLKLLDQKTEAEDVWAVKQIHQLGLWMAGQGSELKPQLLLARDDLPQTTIILAMLKKDRAAGLDALLTPRADEMIFQLDGESQPATLSSLLLDHNWWIVLARDQSGRPPLQNPQALRNWWLIQRRKQGK